MLNLKRCTSLALGSLILGSLTLCLDTPSARAAGQSPEPIVTPMIEVGIGGESQSLEFSSPCPTGGCGDSSAAHSTDSSRGGPVIQFGFKGIKATELMANNVGRFRANFIPISVILDTAAEGDGFGRVAGFDGTRTHIRQVIGALIEGQANPGSGLLGIRAKIVKVEYNRDKGIWDWRALDASAAIQASVKLGDQTTLNLEVTVGGGIGGVHLNGMEDLSRALGAAPAMSGAATINPYAALRAGLYSPSLKIELIGSGEQRVDLSSHDYRVDSTRLRGAAEVEYTFDRQGLQQMGRRYSIFANAAYDFDTLTLSHMVFGSNDAFRSFMVFVGARAQF